MTAADSRAIAVRALAGLLLGIGAGIAVAATAPALGERLLAITDPIGTLWLNALKMTVLPLVFALVVTGLSSVAGTARGGGLAGRALTVFAVMLTGAGLIGATVGPALLALSPPPPGLAAAIPAATVIPEPPGLATWVNTLIPPNVFAAAADGQVLQVLLFALALGFALNMLADDRRRPLLAPIETLADAMLVIVGWVLKAAPFGIAALAFGVGERAGIAGVGTLLHYIVFVSAMCCLALVLALVLAWTWGGVSPVRFLKAAGPAIAVGFGTQSSLATLPLMVQSSRALGVPDPVSRLVLPLAVTLFRITSPIANLSVVLYCAHIFGIEVAPAQLVAATLTALLISFTVVSLPSQITFFASLVPIGAAMGVPPQAYALLIAVEIVPDLFRTVGNVVADISATTIVARRADPVAAPAHAKEA
jgi:Na+/H+-dicarboxylate symporter